MNFQPCHAVRPWAVELTVLLLRQSRQQCASLVFAFSPSSQRDFDGTTAHHCSFMNSLAASKKWCLLVGSGCFSIQSPFGSALQQQRQTSSRGIYPQQPSSSFQWLDVLLPSQERTTSKIQSWKRRGCVYCASHSKPHPRNLLAITLFVLITSWDHGRNLKGKKYRNIEVQVWAGMCQRKDRVIKTAGAIQTTGLAFEWCCSVPVPFHPHFFLSSYFSLLTISTHSPSI